MNSTLPQDAFAAPMSLPVPQPLKTLSIGALTLSSRYCLSPLAAYTYLPFRLAVRELGGVGLATTELVSTRALLLGSPKTKEFIESCTQDTPLSVQLFGADPS